jgi:hypothetical protein
MRLLRSTKIIFVVGSSNPFGMAKKALLDVLEQTIGKYVLNLDAESLNVAVWSGKIELNALLLNCDAVNAELSRQATEAPNLAIPFRVVSGSFDHFQVEVPWAQIMYRPVVLRASGLTIAVEPYNRTTSADYLYTVHESETARARHVEELRDKSIDLADEYRKQAMALRDLAAQDLEANAGTQSNANSTFATRLVRRIIENLQIEITEVTVIVKGSDCSAGVTLYSLSLVTTDSNGKPTFVDRTTGQSTMGERSFLYKALSITGLGIYLDDEGFRKALLAPITENAADNTPVHNYILAPLSFAAKLRQSDSNNCVDFPKYLLASELDSLSVSLSKSQLELASKIAEQIRPSTDVAIPLFPEYRPQKRVTKETAQIWWKYAVRCIGRLSGRRSWVEFYRAFQLRKAYILLYKRHAHHESCSWIKMLSSWEVAQMRLIERDRTISVDGIMVWRNVADAQVRKEKEKHGAMQAKSKGSIFSSLFGTTETGGNNLDEPPITLTVKELQELETFTAAQVVESELSPDSRLCDVKFVLGSLRIDLSSYDEGPIVSLEMGSVSTSFDANQDGSLAFDLVLTSLEIQDRATPRTFFPSVLKNQATASTDSAFRTRYSKNHRGDQNFVAKLSTFEAVASPALLVELKEFASLPKQRSGTSTTNPLLAQSVSGSVDLFYDATEGSDRQEDPFGFLAHDVTPSGTLTDVSNALVSAWKSRSDSKSLWIIDLDIHAPLFVVPESCTSPRANVLVFDFGNLKLQYGIAQDTSSKVEAWYDSNRRSDNSVDPVLDFGSVRISNLTFSIGKVDDWRQVSNSARVDLAIIEPISLSVDFGVENIINQPPRLCAFGVLPSISVQLSPTQLSVIMQVSTTWQNKLKALQSDSDIAVKPSEPSPGLVASNSGDVQQAFDWPQNIPLDGYASRLPCLFATVQLQKLSIKVLDEAGNGIEGHLVSSSLSMSNLSDGSSINRLAMGWFWILDRFHNDFPRKQRLIAHSTLPSSAEAFAKDEKYDIMNEIERLGAFLETFEGSVDLAEITLCQLPHKPRITEINPFADRQLESGKNNASVSLDARFTRLFIIWNPRAVKTMASMLSKFSESFQNHGETRGIVVSSPSQTFQNRRPSLDSTRSQAETRPSGIRCISATMDGLHLSLNSARDDLPLFTGTMASTKVSILSDDNNTRLNLVVGELNVTSACLGQTADPYRTIFGLAPGESGSLLSVRYFSGPQSLEASIGRDFSDCEAFGEVDISPMRMVHIQAQILALVEYATAGILGAVTAQAAASAATAAVDLATSCGSKKVFVVHARGFNLVLPQAAYKTRWLEASLGSMHVEFTMMPDTSAEAQISLMDVVIRDALAEALVQQPVKMDIAVLLRPEGIGTKDDQAMQVGISISSARFILTRSQYAQLLATLEENIGDAELYLRGKSEGTGELTEDDFALGQSTFLDGLTHAGVQVVNDPRRLYLHVNVETLALSLCGVDQEEPILIVSATDAIVDLRSFVDSGRMSTQISLRDMACDDLRLKALSRQYRSLVYQPTHLGEARNGNNNVFSLAYATSGEDSSQLDVKLGSPRIVFIPDVISDVLQFLKIDGVPAQVTDTTLAQNTEYRMSVAIDADLSESGVEASVVQELQSHPANALSLSVSTSQCSILLVDLGSDLLRLRGATSLSMASVAETIVLSGALEAKVSLETEKSTGNIVAMDVELHGDSVEVYTAFGRDLDSAIQILDPTQMSLYANSKSRSGQGKIYDVRCAVVSPVDVTVSMRNVALMNAILSSISDSFEQQDESQLDSSQPLSPQETQHIEQLAIALESDEIEVTSNDQDLSVTDNSVLSYQRSLSHSVDGSEALFKLTTPQMTLTFVNDLQGLDEALMRVTIRSIVANGRVQTDAGGDKDMALFTAFDFNFNTSVIADYFDASTSAWKVLLADPWEVLVKSNRGVNLRFQSNRPSTTIDVESLPCHVSFSEQFLMSLASANRMWSVYSAASSSALESLDAASRESMSLRRNMAASAARTFISSLPYAIENHAGISIDFVIGVERQERRTCANGSLEYFIFEPPVGKGYGGKRQYGQDVSFAKTLSLFIDGCRVDLPHLDSQLSQPKCSHVLRNSKKVVMTHIVKEGKTIVSQLLQFAWQNRSLSNAPKHILTGGSCVKWYRHLQPIIYSFHSFSL